MPHLPVKSFSVKYLLIVDVLLFVNFGSLPQNCRFWKEIDKIRTTFLAIFLYYIFVCMFVCLCFGFSFSICVWLPRCLLAYLTIFIFVSIPVCISVAVLWTIYLLVFDILNILSCILKICLNCVKLNRPTNGFMSEAPLCTCLSFPHSVTQGCIFDF